MINFKNIVGNNSVKSRLVFAAKNGKVPNTQLFTSVDGGSGLQLALSLAKYMACDHPAEDDSCGQCTSCKQFDRFNYPDIHFSFPFSKAKSKHKTPVCQEFNQSFAQSLGEKPYLTTGNWIEALDLTNQQTIIPVSETEAIIHDLALTSFSKKPRFVIIWQPELLHPNASNKLLKTLEEPESNTYFMLVSHHLERLLSTVRSRCIYVKSALNSQNEIIEYLLGKGYTKADILKTILNVKGSIGLAEDLMFEKERHTQYSELFVEWVRLLYAGNVAGIITWSEKLSTLYREEIKEYFSFSSSIFEQALLSNHDAITDLPFSTESFSVEKFAPFIKPHKTGEILSIVEQCRSDISRNAYAKTAILDTSLQLTKYIGKA